MKNSLEWHLAKDMEGTCCPSPCCGRGGTRLFNIMMRGYTYVEMAVLLVMMEVERVGVLMPRDQECHTIRVVIKRPRS